MPEILKIAGKNEYQISKFGTTKTDILIGGEDANVGDKMVPNVNNSWEFESGAEKYFINLNRESVVVTDELAELKDGQLSLTVGDETDSFGVNESLLLWNIEIAKKPLSNIYEWELKFSQGVSFHYQHSLEYQFEHSGGEGADTIEEFLAKTHMPEDIVGSWAVYCDKQNNINYPDGSVKVKYRTGKLCHIYRPYATDANKETVWCDLYIDPDSNLLRVTIPQNFIDTAVYPITLDPDIGHTSCGASFVNSDGVQRGLQVTIGATAGTGDSMSFCAHSDYSNEESAMQLYEWADPGDRIADGSTPVLDGGDGTEKFYAFNFISPPTVEAATDYLTIAWGYDDDNFSLMYDEISTTRAFKTLIWPGSGNPPWVDNNAWDGFGSSTFKYSTYLSYTEVAPPAGAIAAQNIAYNGLGRMDFQAGRVSCQVM